jgi:hypothetical protein
MAVKSFVELKGGSRMAHWDIQSGRNYQRKWLAETDSINDGPRVVLAAFGQKYGTRYQADYNADEKDFAYVNAITVEEFDETGTAWAITLNYGPYDPNQQGGGEDQNPLLMPIEVVWDFRDHEAPLILDVDGRPVLNTAGDPFDPPEPIDDPRLTMTVVRNEPYFNVGQVVRYRNAIASDSFAGFDPLFAKVLTISARSNWHQDAGWYYQVTYQFEFMNPSFNGDNTTGFRKRILNQGLRPLSVVTGQPYHYTLKGVPVSQPVLLGKDGTTLGLNADPYFVEAKGNPELPFSVFNFDPGAISGQRSGLNYSPAPPQS